MNPQVLADQSTFFITFIASFLICLMFFGLFILWIINGKIKKEQVLHAIFSILVAWLISEIVKYFVPELRPFVLNGKPPLTLTIPSFLRSFPSSHATVAFALAVSVWLHNKKTGMFFLICATLVGLGRIFGNVHYIWDVVAGALLGSLSAITVKRLHLFKALK
jgi:undecaprenyl-diphosphatase